MATTCSGVLRVSFEANTQKDYGITDSKVVDSINESTPYTLATTVVDMLYHDDGVLDVVPTVVDLDLQAILNAFGDAITLTKVMGLLIKNNATPATGSSILVGGAVADEWTTPWGAAGDKIHVPPGGVLFLIAPAGITVGAADNQLRLVNDKDGAGTIAYEIFIIGAQ